MEDGRVMRGELYPEKAPNTVNNFISLANKGYYDGLIFHRVIPGFMIQGGCPEGTGMGGPGYCIKGEFFFNGIKNDLKHKRGVLSMARSSSPNSAGSQFFIMHQDAKHLDGQYAAFGKVTSGMEVVDAIAKTRTGMQDRPVEEQKIASITVELNGAALAELKKLPDPYGRF
jgi:peptidyl-prolyl cis-trans isomerase B (cyclophilin B)